MRKRQWTRGPVYLGIGGEVFIIHIEVGPVFFAVAKKGRWGR